jgi:OOP family OmpA-OmpF porin
MLPIPTAPPEEDHVMVRNIKVIPSILAISFSALALNACQASFQVGSKEPKEPATAPAKAPAPPPEQAPKAEAAKPVAEPGNVKVKGDKVEIPGNLVFEFGKATLKEGEGSEKVLEQLKLFLDKNPQVTKLRIEGHTDSVGEAATNEELSGQRALTVKKWLVEKGVPADRLIAVGFGMSKPIADNATEEGRAQNRRTEFKIAGLHGKNYMGLEPTAGGKVYE